MAQRISNVALIVRDYDEAIAFYCGVLGFELQEDTYQPEQDKRWVVVRPRDIAGNSGTTIVLPVPQPGAGAVYRPAGRRSRLHVSGNRRFRPRLRRLPRQGVTFVREPQVMPYGKVAVFADLYGNLWDLVQFSDGHPLAVSSR